MKERYVRRLGATFKQAHAFVLAACVVILTAFAAIALPETAQAQIVMKVSTATLNDAQHEWIRRFVEAVNTASGGRIKGEVYPASQLGSIPRQIEATQLGAIQGWVGPPEFLSGLDARFEVLAAPGVFENMDHAQRILSDPAFDTVILDLAVSKNLKGVGLFLSGPNVIATRKPVHMLSELKGLKLRVLASTIQLEQIKQFGATPVPMALGEVLPAIQQGTIDGIMTSLPVMSAFRYFGVAPNILETNQSYVTSIATLSKRWFDGLPKDLQTIVMDCAVRTTKELYPWISKTLSEQRAEWTAQGGHFTEIPDAERTAVMADLVKVSDSVFSKNPELQATYKALKEAAQRDK
jgi:TRAP-type C4-dicarboxylate transport system substrate-binding protein